MHKMELPSDDAKAAPPKSGVVSAKDEGGLFPKHFVYVLRSLSHLQRTYTGRTENPKQRLAEHNRNACLHTRPSENEFVAPVSRFNEAE